MATYVRLWREIINHPVFADAELFKLFSYCLVRANHKPSRVTITCGRQQLMVDVGRGEFITGMKRLAIDFGCPKTTIRRRLKRLQELGCIAFLVDPKLSRIRITNYGIYQPMPQKGGTQSDPKVDPKRGPQTFNGKARGNKLVSDNPPNEVDPKKISKVDTDNKGKQELNLSCPGSAIPDESDSAKPRTSYTPSDFELASWIWDRIVEMQPSRKHPDLPKWANDIRLMRTRDGRTIEGIRNLFAKVQQDSFWCVNILSPSKLREKYDDLSLKFNSDRFNGRSIGQAKAAPVFAVRR